MNLVQSICARFHERLDVSFAHPWRLSPAPLNREGGQWSYSRRKLNGGFISFASGEWL